MAHCHHQTIARTRAFFDERAANWDSMISAEHGLRLRRIVETLAIAPDAHVMDVGCGTGVLFPILADVLDARGTVVAADISFAMMRETGARIASLQKDAPLPAHLLLQADVTRPPLRDGAFDWIICNSCFPHFHDQQGALTTMARLLRPHGVLVVCHTESRNAINELHRTVGGAVGGHELPDDKTMGGMIATAGLALETLDNQPDAYVLTARKMS